MKRTLALLLTLVLLLTTFAGCVKKKSGTKAKPEDTAEYETLYAPVLKKYKQAFDENWPREKFIENNLSPNLATLEKTAEPSFAFLDLNGDKTPELFIGRKDESARVYDLFTVDAGSIKQLIDTAADTVLTLAEDHRLVKTDDDYAHLDVTTFYEIQNGELAETETLIRDESMMIDGMNTCYRTTEKLPADEREIYADDLEVISQADYDRAAKDYKQAALPMQEFDAIEFDAEPGAPAMSAEDAVAIYMNNRDVWMQNLAEYSSYTGSYSLIFLDLDFDGVLELNTNIYSGGSGLIDYNFYYRIDPASKTVVPMQCRFADSLSSEPDCGPGYEYFIPDANTPDGEQTPLLLRDKKTGEARYFCHGTERSGGAGNWTFYGDLHTEGTAVVADDLFFRVYDATIGEEYIYYVSALGDDPVSEETYEKAKADYFAARDDLHLTWSQVWKSDIEGADDAALRSLLLTSYRAFGYDGYEPAGGADIQWYVPPLSNEEAAKAAFGNVVYKNGNIYYWKYRNDSFTSDETMSGSYYFRSDTANQLICRNRNGAETVVLSEPGAGNIAVWGDRIYYQVLLNNSNSVDYSNNNYKLKSCSLNGSDSREHGNGVLLGLIDGGTYLVAKDADYQTHSIFTINTTTQEKTIISKDEYLICADHSVVCYRTSSDEMETSIYTVSGNGQSSTQLHMEHAETLSSVENQEQLHSTNGYLSFTAPFIVNNKLFYVYQHIAGSGHYTQSARIMCINMGTGEVTEVPGEIETELGTFVVIDIDSADEDVIAYKNYIENLEHINALDKNDYAGFSNAELGSFGDESEILSVGYCEKIGNTEYVLLTSGVFTQYNGWRSMFKYKKCALFEKNLETGECTTIYSTAA